jgi:hypothetical protein
MRMNPWIVALLVGGSLVAPSLARAQGPAAEVALAADGTAAEGAALAGPDAPLEGGGLLATLRLQDRDERRAEGWTILGLGLASVVGGGVLAAVGHADPAALGAGLGTLGWGVVNAALSLTLLDVDGGGARAIERERGLAGPALRARWTGLVRDHRGSAAIFALNTGLDVFYVATGALLAVVAGLLTPPEPGLEGYGIAMAAQGIALLAFDVGCWVRSAARADRLEAALPLP